MRHTTRTLAVVLLTFPLATGCAGAAHDQRMSQGPSWPPAVPPPGAIIPPPTGMSTLTEGAAPIPDHPPVTTSGVVASFDVTGGIVTFQDGRMVKLTDGSTVLGRAGEPALRPGAQVVVHDALPMGMRSASVAPGGSADRSRLSWRGKRQKMGTVAGTDPRNAVVLLTDGTAVHIT